MWKDSDFWIEKWQEDRKNSIFGRRQSRNEAEWWNKRAPGFAAGTGEKNICKNTGILQKILDSPFTSQEEELLDIGCGPGNYAIPLAGRFKKVVAVDSSPVMLSILEERAAKMNIKNIETVCIPWEDVDLDKQEWRKRFGMVIAIKTPGISDAPTLQRMLEASHNGCFYNGFTENEDKAQQDIWRMLFNEEKPGFPQDAFYVFHLLYSWGYIPSLEITRTRTERNMEIQEAIKDLVLMLETYKDIPDTLIQTVKDYIEEKAVNGSYVKVRDCLEGNIMWRV